MSKFLTLLAFLFMSQVSAETTDKKEKEPAKELKIIRITPEGEGVPNPGQVVVEFDQPMVELGQTVPKDVGIEITPEVTGEWHWLNEKTLTLNINQEQGLKKATKYKVVVKPKLKSLGGALLEKEVTHEFTTLLPRSYRANFKTWQSPISPVFVCRFNMPVETRSVGAHVYFAEKASPDSKIAAKVRGIDGDYEETGKDNLSTSDLFLFEPAKTLEPGKEYVIKIEPGVKSEEGSVPGVENEEINTFKTVSEFKFNGFSCRSNNMASDDQAPIFSKDNPQRPDQKCNPMESINLHFSAPVMNSQAKQNLVITPDPTNGKEGVDFWGEQRDYSRLSYGSPDSYVIRLPGGLKADSEYTVSVKAYEPQGFWQKLKRWIKGIFKKQPTTHFKDEFGRKMENPFSVTIMIDNRKPNFEIPNHTAVLEKQADSDVPLYVNNLQSAIFSYRSVTADGAVKDQTHKFEIPQVKNVQFAIAMKVREMLQGKSGAIFGTLETDPTVEKSQYDLTSHTLFAQVTPFQVQVKLGHFNSVVWVTDLATGKVVTGAKVRIYVDAVDDIKQPDQVKAEAITGEDGVATLAGLEVIDPKQDYTHAYKISDQKLFVRVEKDGDIALMPLSSDFQIDNYRASGESFWSTNSSKYKHLRVWGTTPQGIYRAGDKIEYKIYVRNQNNKNLTLPPKGRYLLNVYDATGKVVHEKDNLEFNEFGAISGDLTTPKSASLGWYRFEIRAYFADMEEPEKIDEKTGQKIPPQPTVTATAMNVLVSEFTPSPFNVTVDVAGEIYKPEQDITVLTAAKFHAGGAFTDAEARAVVSLIPSAFESKDPIAEKFSFRGEEKEGGETIIFQKSGRVDSRGEFTAAEKIHKQKVFSGKLTVEGSVKDDRGKSVAARKSLSYLGGDRLVGLREKQWLLTAGKPGEIEVVIVDDKGKPVEGSAELKVQREDVSAAKVKTAGSVYKTDASKEWVDVISQTMTLKGQPESFKFTPEKAGTYKILATTKDAQTREHTAELKIYATGGEYVLWGEETDSYLTIIPEKKEYSVGDKARFLVKNPLPKSKALVTVERFGVIDHMLMDLPDNTPVIELPVKPEYLPNFYVSVTVFAPRAESAKELKIGELDLAKPAMRTGYAAIKVKDHYKDISVTAKPERDVYKPREKVKLSLNAKVKNPGEEKEPIELAVVVIDDAVFDLIQAGRQYYDPYDGFYRQENLDMTTYSLLNGLVGRMKFEKKGANAGGDGGADLSFRNIFKYVSYWNPSLKLDAQGNASVEFEAPDNLTGWRIFAIAVTPTDRLGLGESTFKVNRPTEVRPVMPNQVSEGDSFEAGFTVMNRTDKKRSIKVSISASGNVDGTKMKSVLEQTLELDPNQRSAIYLPVVVGAVKEDEGAIKFEISAGDALDTDKTEHTVPVKKIRIMDTQTFYGTMTDGVADIPVNIPTDIFTDAGGISLNLSASVISNLAGVFTYMRGYPYPCWEQKSSRAVIAAYFKDLKKYVGDEVSWPNSEEFVKEMIAEAANYQASNGGMAYFLAKDEYVDPFLSAFTALAFSWLKEQGHEIPVFVEEKLLKYLDTLMKKDFPENYYTPGMVATTRAVILEALSYRGKTTVDDLERFLPHLAQMNAFGKASFARAAMNTKGAEKITDKVIRELMSHFNETAGKITWAEDLTTSSLRILDTPLRETCSVLETFSRYAQTGEGRALIGDKATKLVRTVSEARKKKNHWENTQENIYCARALTVYSKSFESETPGMTIVATRDKKEMGQAKFFSLTDKPVDIKSSFGESDPGQRTEIKLNHEGKGRLYYSTRLQYAMKAVDAKAVNSGIEVRREHSILRDNKWVLLKDKETVKKGDLVRTDLFVLVPGDRTFVVVNDPVAGGVEPLNTDLATASQVDQNKMNESPAEGSYWHTLKDWVDFDAARWAFYFKEVRQDSVRFYADYLPKGNYFLSHVGQVIADGTFSVAPTLAEEMYNPETYGRGVGAVLAVH